MDSWPRTEHWKRDHRSNNITEHQLRYLREVNRPIVANVCEQCGWPASIAKLCMSCCDMAESIFPQKGLVEAHEAFRRQQMERRMGLL
jgi:hypothetical protein